MDFLEKLLESHRTYWAMIGESKTSAVLAIAIASLAGLFELMTLFLIAPLLGLSFKIDFQGVVGKVFAFIASNETLSNPWVQFSALLALVAMSIGARWVAFRYFVNLRFKIIVRLRRDMLDQMIEMPWPRYHRVAGGSITSSLGQAVWQIGEGIEQYLQMIANFFIVVVLVSAAFFIAPSLALIVPVFVALVALGSSIVSRLLRKHTDQSIIAAEKAAIVSHQIYENLKYVRVSGIVHWAREKCGLSYNQERGGHTRMALTNALHHFGLEFAGMALIGVLILTFRLSETVGFGRFVVFIGLLYRSLPRIQMLQASRVAADGRLRWIEWWRGVQTKIGTSQVRNTGGHALPSNFEGCLEFDRVGFAYCVDETQVGKPVFTALSFKVAPGQLLALVGSSGAGKSTVVDLISGLISPQSGKILVDGIDMEAIDMKAWRDRIGYLPQEPLLFSGTVLSNVAFATDAPDKDRAMQCLKAAQAWDFVQKMPGGLEAEIGQRGGRLSGGEKQRLALARALYRRPRLLLLDEPTSALDEVSAMHLGEVLENLKQDVAIVMVTHQLKLLDIADIVVNLTPPNRTPDESWAEEIPSIEPWKLAGRTTAERLREE